MKIVLKKSAVRAAAFAKGRPSEITGTAIGTIAGVAAGLLIGGVGIVALGGAFGLSASAILALVGGLVGNRIGMERDRLRDRK